MYFIKLFGGLEDLESIWYHGYSNFPHICNCGSLLCWCFNIRLFWWTWCFIPLLTLAACWYILDRRAKCIPWFRAAYCCCKGDQEVHPSCKENCFCGGARLHHGNLPSRQGYSIWGQAFYWLSCQLPSVPCLWHEPLLVRKCLNRVCWSLLLWFLDNVYLAILWCSI